MNFTREKRLRSRSEQGTIALGEMMTELLPPPKLVVLRGPLGAGKTTLVKGMAAALGAARPEEVTSPTFTLLHSYAGKRATLHHLDLYRLDADHELEAVGLWELAAAPDALVLVEWGEKFPSIVAQCDAEISIETGENATERLFHVRWRDAR